MALDEPRPQLGKQGRQGAVALHRPPVGIKPGQTAVALHIEDLAGEEGDHPPAALHQHPPLLPAGQTLQRPVQGVEQRLLLQGLGEEIDVLGAVDPGAEPQGIAGEIDDLRAALRREKLLCQGDAVGAIGPQVDVGEEDVHLTPGSQLPQLFGPGGAVHRHGFCLGPPAQHGEHLLPVEGTVLQDDRLDHGPRSFPP